VAGFKTKSKMKLLENFKEQIYIDNISKTIIGKVGSLPRNCGFPQFMLNDEKFIKKFFGEKAYNFYSQMSDLENFAHLDYPDGVSKIFVKNLNNIDTYLRPIHCSDLKRETIYIKDNNKWIKESEDKPLLKNAIKKIANKNIRQITEWVKEHPGCQDPTTKQNVKYNKIVMNSMSGGTVEEQHNNIEQIVKNVTKAVVIDKYAIK
jgi:hypothetical protein